MNGKPDLLHYLAQRIFIMDGAMGTSLDTLRQRNAGLRGASECNEYLNLTHPDAVRRVHAAFIDAGCMGVTTNSFGGSRLKLAHFGLESLVRDINAQAARIAREAAGGGPEPRYAIGSIGPTGMLPSSNDAELGSIPFDDLVSVFEEQAAALISGGVDALAVETSQDILEAKAAVVGCRRAMRAMERPVPLMAHVTLDANGRMLLGTDIGAALVTLEGMEIDVIGINCSTGPEEMRDSVRFLGAHASLPISCKPNMGIPRNMDGIPEYPLTPRQFAEAMNEFVTRFGVRAVGGCCGSTPRHLAALAGRLRDIPAPARGASRFRAISSGITFVPLRQSPPPLIVGERVNAQGSRAMKQLLLADDLDGIARLAQRQVDHGAHAIDVCVALNERDGEARRFVRLAKELALRVSAPIMIDSTDGEVIREATKIYPGRVIINSINLEHGERRIDELAETIRTYGAYVVALAIDERGMARTSADKTEIAVRISRILQETYAIPPERIIFDALTFTLATGDAAYRTSALETLAALESIKQAVPDSLTILGISNVSFGLPRSARPIVNSVFLYHALGKGLDLAIVNPAEITPYPEIGAAERELAERLLFNAGEDPLGAVIDHFQRALPRPSGQAAEPLSPEEEIRRRILNRNAEDIERLLDSLMSAMDPTDIVNGVLLPAMKEVGEKFGSGELILPFVLQSAEVMKRALRHLEPYLGKKEDFRRGRVVLATVSGDVHDIGKNLVKTILSNNGYAVKDLGRQVPAHEIVEAAREFRADAVGLSALLVSTSRQMPIVAQELFRAGLHVPMLVGGAAVSPQFARKSAILDDGTEYPGGIFYAKDAFDGLRILDALAAPSAREKILAEYRTGVRNFREREGGATTAQSRPPHTARSGVPRVEPPAPPFWGARKLSGIELDEVFACLDEHSLYRLSWGVRGMNRAEYDRIVRERFEPLLRELKRQAAAERFLLPEAMYGFFPCMARGDELVVFGPDGEEELASIRFPRQRGKKLLSIADYFRDDVVDVLPIQLVTIGPRASEVCELLNAAGDYSRSYFIHGLSVQAAEALAAYVHRRALRELGLDETRGRRYSPGFPACPDVEMNALILRLLQGEKNLGVTLTSAFQFVPVQTTAALIVHHPGAEYFHP
jgi:5-methyltetrahydrofolate--homocysteine methyltransferase